MFVLTLLIFFGMAAVHTDGAHASLSCAFDPTTGTLSLAPGTGALRASVGVSAGPSPPAGAIALTDLSAANAPVVVACAGGATGRAPSTPTTANTAKILVAGGSESDLLEIDLSGGSFRSGLSADGEVAWRVALAAGTDTLRVKGNKLFVAQNFRVVYGSAPGPLPTVAPAGSLNLTAGSDARADISVDTDVEIHQVLMGAGDDVVSGNGQFGTGGPWEATGLDFDGGDGHDVLRATTINNSKSNTYRQVGGAGNDELTFLDFGSAGAELTQEGGDGGDVLRATNLNSSKSNTYRQAGGAGNDTLTFADSQSGGVQLTQEGGDGGDVLRATTINNSKSNNLRQSGGSGNDELTVESSNSSRVTVRQDGGPGRDLLRATNLNSSKSNTYRQLGSAGDDELTVENSNSSRVTVRQDGGPGGDLLRATNLNSSKSNTYRQGGPGNDKCSDGVGRVKDC